MCNTSWKTLCSILSREWTCKKKSYEWDTWKVLLVNTHITLNFFSITPVMLPDNAFLPKQRIDGSNVNQTREGSTKYSTWVQKCRQQVQPQHLHALPWQICQSLLNWAVQVKTGPQANINSCVPVAGNMEVLHLLKTGSFHEHWCLVRDRNDWQSHRYRNGAQNFPCCHTCKLERHCYHASQLLPWSTLPGSGCILAPLSWGDTMCYTLAVCDLH